MKILGKILFKMSAFQFEPLQSEAESQKSDQIDLMKASESKDDRKLEHGLLQAQSCGENVSGETASESGVQAASGKAEAASQKKENILFQLASRFAKSLGVSCFLICVETNVIIMGHILDWQQAGICKRDQRRRFVRALCRCRSFHNSICL